MFVPEGELREVIVEILRGEEKSISAIHRELENRGLKVHRLLLTGYLRAMVEMGVLRERVIPPSKVYTVVSSKKKDIYDAVGEKVREVCGAGEENEGGAQKKKRDLLTLYVLQRLFLRPVFLYELKKAGADVPDGASEVKKGARRELRKFLAMGGSAPPPRNPAYQLDPEKVPEDVDEKYVAVLEKVLLDVTYSNRLRKETKQTHLTDIGRYE